MSWVSGCSYCWLLEGPASDARWGCDGKAEELTAVGTCGHKGMCCLCKVIMG